MDPVVRLEDRPRPAEGETGGDPPGASAPVLHRQPDWGAVQGILNELDRNVRLADVKRQVSAVALRCAPG